MANILSPDSVDFSAYIKETEGKHKVRLAGQYVQEMIDALGVQRNEPRSYLPWDKTHGLVQFRPGEVTLWAGVNGQGKSMVTGQTVLSLCAQGERVCVASFEMKPRKTLGRMLRQWSGQSEPEPHELADNAVLTATRDLYEQFRDWTNTCLWLYDQQGTVKTDTLIGVIRYCVKELRITHFVVDSLMKCVPGEDDYNAQKNFVDQLTSLARDNGMHIHLVHHIRKLGSDDDMPDKTDVKGSGSITDQVDNVLLFWRNVKKERDTQMGKTVATEEPDARLICAKQRNGDWEGRIALWFNKESQQYRANSSSPAINFFNWPHRDA